MNDLGCQPTAKKTLMNAVEQLNVTAIGNTVLAVRCYQIDFGNHLRCKIKVTDNGIEVEGAINGWGDGVPLDEVVVVEVQ